MKNLEIITPRLLIRVPRIEDAVELNAGLNSIWHELQLWTSFAFDDQKTLEATKTYIVAEIDLSKDDGRLPLIGICRETGRIAVSTGLHMEGSGRMATGYWTPLHMQRKGYASEACNAVTRYAFDVLSVDAMHICYFEGNVPSERVISKLGFAKTGVREKGKARCLDGMLVDVHEFVMTDPAVLPPLKVSW